MNNPPCECAKCEENPLCPNCYVKFKATECEAAAQDAHILKDSPERSEERNVTEDTEGTEGTEETEER